MCKERKKVFDAHESYVRCHFKVPDMDSTFGSFVLGVTLNEGCEIGETLRTAARIRDGDAKEIRGHTGDRRGFQSLHH